MTNVPQCHTRQTDGQQFVSLKQPTWFSERRLYPTSILP